MNFRNGFVLSVAISALFLASCGGGGSSSPAPMPVPPPPTGGPSNTAPVASATTTNLSPSEGQKTTLDGSGSSDADGDSLSYQWSQLSGPDLQFENSASVSTELSIPNLAANVTARIQLQVSDGTVTSTDDVTLSLQNISLSPLIDDAIVEDKTFNYANEVLAIPTRQPSFETENYLVYQTDDQVFIDRFGYDDGDDPAITEAMALGIESSELTFEGSPKLFGVSYLAEFRNEEVVFLEPFKDTPEILSIPVEQPCSLVSNENRDLGNTFIGSRGGTSRLIEFQGEAGNDPTGWTERARFGTGADLCEMQIVQRPIDESSAGFSDGRRRLLAFDQNANAVIEYAITRNDEGRIIGVDEQAIVPVQLDVSEGTALEFVDAKKINSVGIEGLALVYSNGEAEGIHRLVIVGAAGDGSVIQDTYSWDFGTPKSIISGNVDNHQGDSLFITTADSPYGVIFKSGGFFVGGTTYLPLEGPSYFDLGVGHDLVERVSLGSQRRSGIVVTYPEQESIKVFERERP